jgi:hypothetical protein
MKIKENTKLMLYVIGLFMSLPALTGLMLLIFNLFIK